MIASSTVHLLYKLESNTDFEQIQTTLTFGACERHRCTRIPITDDTILESTESFSIHLVITTSFSNGPTVDPNIKVVNISDNDGTFLYV